MTRTQKRTRNKRERAHWYEESKQIEQVLEPYKVRNTEPCLALCLRDGRQEILNDGARYGLAHSKERVKANRVRLLEEGRGGPDEMRHWSPNETCKPPPSTA